jgi:hypothetical protein
MADSGKIVLRYVGPAQQVCYALGEYGYSPLLKREISYELPAELAESLLASNVHFVRAEGYKFPAMRETTPEQWRYPESVPTMAGNDTTVTVTSSPADPFFYPEQNQGE